VHSSNRLFFRHPPHLNRTTTNSGQRLCSLLSCIFLGNFLDMIESALTLADATPTNPMAIHRFNTFLGMTALSNRSEVSYLSRGRRRKDGSIEWAKRSRDQPHKTRAKRRAESRDSESSPEIHCDHRQCARSIRKTPSSRRRQNALPDAPSLDQRNTNQPGSQ
jgi:hypothetical protein